MLLNAESPTARGQVAGGGPGGVNPASMQEGTKWNHFLQQHIDTPQLNSCLNAQVSLFFFKPENEVIPDSSGILCLQMKLMLPWGLHYQLTRPNNEV